MRLGPAAAAALALCLILPAPAGAVWPGATGRLAVHADIYDPPNPAVMVDTGFIRALRFSPDGTRIVSTKPSTYGEAVWIADADGTNQKQITFPGTRASDLTPTWTPDGTEVVMDRMRDATCNGSPCFSHTLTAVNVETGAERHIRGPGYGDSTRPTWRRPEYSPDGRTIAVGFYGSNYAGIELIDVATGTWSRPESLMYHDNARFSPDGTMIVAGGTASGLRNPWAPVTLVDREDPSRVIMSFKTVDEAYTTYPTFTPEGDRITFGDCRPECGMYSKPLPTLEAPDAPVTLELPVGGTESPMDWEPLVDAPIISAGPSGTVRGSTATFEFAVPTAQKGYFQCRIVGRTAFATCTSPKTYTGLPDGEHTFEVRYVLENADPEKATVTSRTWTSDSKAPIALIDQAPSGTVSAAEATIVFHSSEPDGATFLCRLDGEPEHECSSPHRITTLAEGPHTFAVRAADAVGNVQDAPTVVSWNVDLTASGGGGGGGGAGGGGATPQPESSCAAPAVSRVEVGSLVAVARGATCFQVAKRQGETTYTATGGIGAVTINGIQVTPRPGARVIVEKSLSDVTVRLTGPSTFGFGAFSWTIPIKLTLPLGKAGTASKFALPFFEEIQKKAKLEIAGLRLAAAPVFELSAGDGGSTKVGLKLALPSAFRGLKSAGGDVSEKQGGLTFEFSFGASHDTGVRFAAKGSVDTAYVFSNAKLTDLTFGFDTGPPLSFEGAGTLTLNESKLPTGISREQAFTVSIGLSKEGGAWPNVEKIAVQASKFQKPLAYNFYLQRFGGEFNRCQDAGGLYGGRLSANAGISFGPRLDLKPVFEGEAVSIDGKVELTLCRPDKLEVTGEGKIVDVKVAGAGVKFPFDGTPELSGELDLTLGGYGFLGKIEDSWFDLRQGKFNVQASTELKLPGWLGGGRLDGRSDTLVSSVGFAACWGPDNRRIGIAKAWGQPIQPLISACDVGPYRATAATARAAQTGRARTVMVERGTKLVVIEVGGAGSAPKAALTGPGGRSVQTPAGLEALDQRDALVIQDPERRRTTFVLFDPPAGTWTVAPVPGAEPFGPLRVADALPPVDVTAKVVKARNARRELRWKLAPHPGQEVTFVERGDGVSRVVKSTSRRAGRVRFRPDPGRGRARRIEAVVTQHGLQRTVRTVARYTVPKVKLRRVGRVSLRGARLSWRASAGAAAWSVLLRDRTATTRSIEAGRPRVRVPRGMSTRRLRVTLAPLDAAGRPGPSRTFVLGKRQRR